jgi:rSAM/selenodomain-associated transferase 2
MDLSIIIPTLNEEKYIGETLNHVYQNLSDKYSWEIILVDNGSQDRTTSLAKGFIVSIYNKPGFIGKKYLSLNFGAQQAKGKYLMFLDADCQVPKHFDESIVNTLCHKNNVGGAFEFKMAKGGIIFSAIELINRIRYRISKKYYGDQGVFCSKEAFEQIGGFPEKPIMEAAYFCDNLAEAGELRLIKSKLISSVRRFEEGGIIRVIAKDSWIWFKYMLGLDISNYAPAYWKDNEERGKDNKA